MKLISRAVYRIYRLFFGVRHWCKHRLTPSGVGVLGAMVVAAIMGPDTENNVAYQAFTLLACMLAVAAAFSLGFGGSFSARRVLPRFGTAGSPLAYGVLIKNLTSKNQAGLTLIEELADTRPSFHEWHERRTADRRAFRSFRFSYGRPSVPFRRINVKDAPIPTATPQEAVEVRLELTPLHRGVLRFKSIRLGRPDPLGLFRALIRLPLPQTTLILPRRYPLPPISFPGTLQYQDGGVALASNVGQSDEFVALRDYRHGDPIRHIHWRSWAKTGKPVVKEFEDEFFVRHALVLDTFTEDVESEVFEEAVSVAASFACSIQSQESLLDLLFVGPQSFRFTAGRGLAHTDQMLEVLASVRPCGDKPFATLESLVINHIGVVSGCICVLLAWDEERRQFVEKLRKMGVPVLVLVVTTSGKRSSFDPASMSEDPSRFKVLEVGKVKEGLAQLV